MFSAVPNLLMFREGLIREHLREGEGGGAWGCQGAPILHVGTLFLINTKSHRIAKDNSVMMQ